MKTKMKLSEVPKYKDLIVAFLKFSPYIDSLIDGNVYMNNLKYYIGRENETGDKGLGDKLEGSLVMSKVNLKIYDKETGEQVSDEMTVDAKLRFEWAEKQPIFCLFSVNTTNMVIVEEHEEYYVAELDYTIEEKEKMISEFGNQLVVIDALYFTDRFKKVCSEKGYELAHGRVKYDDFSITSTERLKSYSKNSTEMFFWKDKYFENQNEYRFLIANYETDDPIIVNIGDISDISRKGEARDFFFGGKCKFRMPK